MSEPVTHINGKLVKDHIDLPHGGFAKLVREKTDPLWGKLEGEGELRRYLVTCDYEFTEEGTRTMVVEAACEKDAEKIASLEFDGEDYDYYGITSVEREVL